MVFAQRKAFRLIGDVLLTAVAYGDSGNLISCVLADTDESAGAVVTNDGNAISISIEAGVTTAKTIADAINAASGAGEAGTLVVASYAAAKETTAQAAAALQYLLGGFTARTNQAEDLVQLGTVGYSDSELTDFEALVEAGVAVRLASTGLLALTKASGCLVGISAGRSLSDTAKTSVIRVGKRVPIKLTKAFVPTIAQTVYIDDVTGRANATDTGAIETTICNAVYESGPLFCVDEDGALAVETDGTLIMCALVNMQGGL